MRIIGLTGGIASGKSTVADLLERLGFPVIDADLLAREVVAPGEPAYEQIVAEFGPAILLPDRTIDRPSLGGIVFADREARRRLEAITHPAIRERSEQRLAELEQAGAEIVFYMAPLLLEAGRSSTVDEIWVVYLDLETQLSRLMTRDGSSREEALRRIGAQMPMEEKRRFGAVVLDNRGTPDDLERQIRAACTELRKRLESA